LGVAGTEATMGVRQGDQIGRIFANLAIVYKGQLSKIYKSSPKILATSSAEKSYVVILTKRGWAMFWAIFSQTHLVTLACGRPVF
jgi:hypothetical protein